MSPPLVVQQQAAVAHDGAGVVAPRGLRQINSWQVWQEGALQRQLLHPPAVAPQAEIKHFITFQIQALPTSGVNRGST